MTFTVLQLSLFLQRTGAPRFGIGAGHVSRGLMSRDVYCEVSGVLLDVVVVM